MAILIGLGFGVWSLEFGVWGLGFGVDFLCALLNVVFTFDFCF